MKYTLTAALFAAFALVNGIAVASPPTGYGQLGIPVLMCDTSVQLKSLIDARAKGAAEGVRAFQELHNLRNNRFQEPSCMFSMTGPVAIGDQPGDVIDVGIQKPDDVDQAVHIWMLHVGNSQTDFWVMWSEAAAIVDPASCSANERGCI